MTCALFVGAVAYIGGDSEFAERLKIPHLTHEIKELSVLATTVLSAGTAFLKIQRTTGPDLHGGSGCPGIGKHGFGHVHFRQSGIVPADCGRDFYFSVLSSIIQRLFFKWMLHTRGREKAERFRFSSDPLIITIYRDFGLIIAILQT